MTQISVGYANCNNDRIVVGKELTIAAQIGDGVEHIVLQCRDIFFAYEHVVNAAPGAGCAYQRDPR